jgi:murein L,D-transpeptidase YcbB/YkuD
MAQGTRSKRALGLFVLLFGVDLGFVIRTSMLPVSRLRSPRSNKAERNYLKRVAYSVNDVQRLVIDGAWANWSNFHHLTFSFMMRCTSASDAICSAIT